MTTTVSTLANGLRIATHRMPHLETVSLGVWVAVGARHEADTEHGLSHLLEHMAFKGTARRTARGIAEEIEEVGGELNAATSLESTAYYARVLKGDERVALDILADILQNPRFENEELEREREVILQEIAATQDSPEEIVFDLFHDAAFPGQPVGRPVLGTPASIAAIGGAELRTFLGSHYRADGMVLAAAGAVDHDALHRHAEALFGGLSAGRNGAESPASYAGGTRLSSKAFEQSHVVLGFEGPSYRHADYFTAMVFSGLLGGGMSSRLFQEAREKRGLCYSIYSSAWGLSDAGMLGIHAATGPAMLGDLIDVVGRELKSLAADGPEAPEVVRAKAQIKAGLLMSLESSSARAEQMARHLLAHGRLLTAEELIARVDDVTPERIREHAARLEAGPRPTVAIVGAGKRGRANAKKAEQILAR